MNPLLGLLFLYAARNGSSSASSAPARRGKHKRGKRARWPGTKHPPPKTLSTPATEPMEKQPHETERATPAEDTRAADTKVDTHRNEPTEHAAHDANTADALHDVRDTPTDAGKHVEQHQGGGKVTKLPVQHIRGRVKRKHKRKHAPAAADDGTRSVASIQSVLRGLGWRGRLTMKGPVSRDLTDGESPLHWPAQPSATFDDWQQSARKRKLDPSIERLGPNTARVNPDTYRALSAIAQPSVAGLYIP